MKGGGRRKRPTRQQRRQTSRWYCTAHKKGVYRTFRIAEKVIVRLKDPGYIYWCPIAGGYHITRLTPTEFDQRKAEYLNLREEEDGEESDRTE